MPMEATPHLLTSQEFLIQKNREYSLALQKVFIASCLNLNASILEPYINEDDVFENKEKYLFLVELKKLFQPYQPLRSILSVRREEKTCLGCSKGKNVVQFIISSFPDNKEVFDFGFVIDTENGILKDIYRCYWYNSNSSHSITTEGLQIKPEGLPAITIRDFDCK